MPLPADADPRIAEVFERYTKVVAPNGKPIHILAQGGWRLDQILRTRGILEHLLADVPGSRLGADKSAVANSMADRRATLVLFDDEPAMERALAGPLGDLELGFQDLRANECPVEGDPDYMAHDTRDAAFEEILHLVHDYGIRPVLPDYDEELHRANLAAQAAGAWAGWPEEEPENHRNEYFAAIYDNYLDLWTVTPTRYEGELLFPDMLPTGTSHFGTYAHGSRAALRSHDPVGHALLEDFLPATLTYEARLPEDFSGEFSLRPNPALRYTTKAQHLTRVHAPGPGPTRLLGNEHDNELRGGAGDDQLEGWGGDDQLAGGGGTDVALYRGPASDYAIERAGANVFVLDRVAERDGHDRLAGIERLRFADGEVEVGVPALGRAPSAHAASRTTEPHQGPCVLRGCASGASGGGRARTMADPDFLPGRITDMAPFPFTASTLVLFLCLPASFGSIDEAEPAEEPAEGPAPEDFSFETRHSIVVDGHELPYVAVAETTLLRDGAGEPEAEFFTVSYFAGAESSAAQRPIAFAFNGGPGSASVWLHMGLLGPKRIVVPSDGQAAGAPPYPIVDNPHTLLAVSDLVFVDPIGTGLSRVVEGGKAEDHWGVDEDAASVARFIRRYLSVHERWASPKYVLGESYGGIRGPLLVRDLQGGFNSVALNGLVLVSPALHMGVVDGQSNDAAFATVLPTYAATAAYHGALPEAPADLDAFLQEVETWATEQYIPALFAGNELSAERRDAVIDGLHRYTGLSREYIERANLKVSTDRFRRELLRDRGLVVGRLDTRYTGTEADDVGEIPSGDPMGAGIAGAYVAGFQSYLRSTLGVSIERSYVIMSEEAGQNWKRPAEEWPAFQGYVDVRPELARGMADNPDLRLFVASGLYDIATTPFAAEVNIRRSTIDRARVVRRDYPAGHMMYVHEPTLIELARDLKEFVRAGGERRTAGAAATEAASGH